MPLCGATAHIRDRSLPSNEKYITEINDQYLKKYQEEFNHNMLLAIENNHDEFKPFRPHPKHYILSIYDPLELYYGLLGSKNLAIKFNFTEKEEIDKDLIQYFLSLIHISEPTRPY